MHTLKRTALAVTVAGLMLFTAACGSSGGDKATPTTTTITAGTTVPGNGAGPGKGTGKAFSKGKKKTKSTKPAVIKYCQAVATQKAKTNLTTLAAAKTSVAAIQAVNQVAPPGIKASHDVYLRVATQLAGSADAAAFNQAKTALKSNQEWVKAYKKLVYFNTINC